MNLLHSGLPIEYVIFAIMCLWSKENEEKLSWKINDVEFGTALSNAMHLEGDREQLVNRIMNGGRASLTDAEKDAINNGNVDSVPGLVQKLRDIFHAGDEDIKLLKNVHSDDPFHQACQFFSEEVGSSAEVKAQELNIAMAEFKDMSEAISGIISTLQKLTDDIIAKIGS
jgi:hypothetical protein